jgi:hypothetical protein
MRSSPTLPTTVDRLLQRTIFKLPPACLLAKPRGWVPLRCSMLRLRIYRQSFQHMLKGLDLRASCSELFTMIDTQWRRSRAREESVRPRLPFVFCTKLHLLDASSPLYGSVPAISI